MFETFTFQEKPSPIFLKQFSLGTFIPLHKRIQLTDQSIYCSDQFFFPDVRV